MPRLTKSDIYDSDIVDAYELASDGYHLYKILSVISTTSGTKTVVVSPPGDEFGLVYDLDAPVAVGDRVLLTGTLGGGDGYFIIASVIDNTTFTISETIGSSTGGDGYFMYPSGSLSVGFDSSGILLTTADNVQDAIVDLADEITAGGITATAHQVLRQLIHFLDTGPANGFASGAYQETSPSGSIFPTSIIWWESSAKLKKIVEENITWSGIVPSQITWNMYDTDGVTIIQTVTDDISYTSTIFETSRTRTIS